jgi:hypothetical protein
LRVDKWLVLGASAAADIGPVLGARASGGLGVLGRDGIELAGADAGRTLVREGRELAGDDDGCRLAGAAAGLEDVRTSSIG